MSVYNLGFISDDLIFQHVMETVNKYRFSMSLADFQSNIIDPIKLTFDSKIYKKDISSIIDSEIIRQIDKSNTNHIGYFHQNLFKYMGQGWTVPINGYDVENIDQNIFVEMKNKHNTMNSSSSQKTYMQMMSTCLKNPQATCYLVEVIAKKSQDIQWKAAVNGEVIDNPRIRRMSIDQFYKLVTGDPMAFMKLCRALPKILDDVISSKNNDMQQNTVFSELKAIDPDILKSLYLFSFKTYEGFNGFSF